MTRWVEDIFSFRMQYDSHIPQPSSVFDFSLLRRKSSLELVDLLHENNNLLKPKRNLMTLRSHINDTYESFLPVPSRHGIDSRSMSADSAYVEGPVAESELEHGKRQFTTEESKSERKCGFSSTLSKTDAETTNVYLTPKDLHSTYPSQRDSTYGGSDTESVPGPEPVQTRQTIVLRPRLNTTDSAYRSDPGDTTIRAEGQGQVGLTHNGSHDFAPSPPGPTFCDPWKHLRSPSDTASDKGSALSLSPTSAGRQPLQDGGGLDSAPSVLACSTTTVGPEASPVTLTSEDATTIEALKWTLQEREMKERWLRRNTETKRIKVERAARREEEKMQLKRLAEEAVTKVVEKAQNRILNLPRIQPTGQDIKTSFENLAVKGTYVTERLGYTGRWLVKR